VGWGLVAVVLVRAAIVTVCGYAWALLHRDVWHLPATVWPLLRWVREGINVLLPVGTVGGEIVGARLLTFWGVAGGLAAAGVLVDLLVQAIGQTLFTLAGVVLVLRIPGAEVLAEVAIGGLILAFAGLGGFFLVLRRNGAEWLHGLITKAVAKWSDSATARALDVAGPKLVDGLDAIWRRPRLVGASLGVHVAGWLMGTLEIWIAMTCMGHPVSWTDALILESIGQAIRGAAFPVPGGVGVQEGGFLVVGNILGLDPQSSIALSFVKRVPDVVLGLPALLAWHTIEHRQRAAGVGPADGARKPG
jgi:putative membrane protein